MPGTWLRRFALAFVVGVTSGASAVALAAGGGSRVVRISAASGYAEAPVIAADARGDQTVAWTDYGSGSSAQFSVLTATRGAGSGSWSRPTAISGVSQGPDAPALALAPSGAAVIAWTETVPAGRKHSYVTVLRAATRAAASVPWTHPSTISAPGTQASRFAVGIDSAGKATVVWSQGLTTTPAIESAAASTITGRWGEPQQLAAAGHGGLGPQLAVNPRGDTLVAWPRQVSRTKHRNYQPTIHYTEMAAYRPAGRAWQASVSIGRLSEIEPSPGGDVWAPSAPTIALDSRGGATVMWQSIRGRGQVLEIAHRTSPSRRWPPARPLTMNPTAPVLGTDGRGELTVVWTNQRGRILYTGSQNAAHWSHPATVGGATQAFLTWLSVGSDGKAILTWRGAHSRVLVSRRGRPGTGWTRPVVVGRGGFPQAALDRADRATLVWPRLLPRPKFGAVIDTTTYPTG